MRASDGSDFSGFDSVVAIEGSLLALGVPNEDLPPFFQNLGVVYIFRDTGGVWAEELKIWGQASEAQFASRVEVSNNRVFAGGNRTGYIAVFVDIDGEWFTEAFLTGVPTDFGIGAAIATDGNVVVGFSDKGQGRVHVYRYDGMSSVWEHEQVIWPPDLWFEGRTTDVAVFGDSLLIGNDVSSELRRGYLYHYGGPTFGWTLIARLDLPAQSGDFGKSAALSNGMALLSANSFGTPTPDKAVYYYDVSNPDCNNNGSPDLCDINGGGSFDANANGIPDECEATTDIPAISEWGLVTMALLLV